MLSSSAKAQSLHCIESVSHLYLEVQIGGTAMSWRYRWHPYSKSACFPFSFTLAYHINLRLSSCDILNILWPHRCKGAQAAFGLQVRNPCYHPGDIRILKAVDVPGCRHLKDCVVFPVRGDRPHPDEMAGGEVLAWAWFGSSCRSTP